MAWHPRKLCFICHAHHALEGYGIPGGTCFHGEAEPRYGTVHVQPRSKSSHTLAGTVTRRAIIHLVWKFVTVSYHIIPARVRELLEWGCTGIRAFSRNKMVTFKTSFSKEKKKKHNKWKNENPNFRSDNVAESFSPFF